MKPANKQDYLARLQEGIQTVHKCAATHRRTVPVHETAGAQTLWDGEVEVFWLAGHPKAKRCYAWLATGGKEERVVAILEIGPVIGPATAVRAALRKK